MNVYTDVDLYYLAHHGIEGQKWGVTNGPPYPLDGEDHSAAERRAGTSGWSEEAQREMKSAYRQVSRYARLAGRDKYDNISSLTTQETKKSAASKVARNARSARAATLAGVEVAKFGTEMAIASKYAGGRNVGEKLGNSFKSGFNGYYNRYLGDVVLNDYKTLGIRFGSLVGGNYLSKSVGSLVAHNGANIINNGRMAAQDLVKQGYGKMTLAELEAEIKRH